MAAPASARGRPSTRSETPGLVEVRRDPAEEERPAGAEQQARVDVLRRADHPFVEEAADLVGERLEHGLGDLLRRAPALTDDDDLVLPVREVRERRREREAVGIGLVHRLEHVVRDARADELQQDGRRHRHPELDDRLVRLLDAVAVLERVHEDARHSRQHAVDDEARRVLRHDTALAQLPAHVPRRRDRLVRRVVVPDDLDERQYGHRVEEVQPDVGAHLGERQRRRVRGEDRVRRELSQSREDLLLDRELLDDRFENEVAVLEALPAGRAGDERRPRADLGADVRERGVDELVGEVTENERDLEPLHEQRRELPRHQAAADDADLLDRARLTFGTPTPRFWRRSTRLKA